MLPENLVAVSGSLVMMAGVDLPRTCLLTGTLNPLSSYSYTSGSGPVYRGVIIIRMTLNPLSSYSYTSGSGPVYEGGGGDNYVTLYMGGDNYVTLYMGGDNCIWGR